MTGVVMWGLLFACNGSVLARSTTALLANLALQKQKQDESNKTTEKVDARTRGIARMLKNAVLVGLGTSLAGIVWMAMFLYGSVWNTDGNLERMKQSGGYLDPARLGAVVMVLLAACVWIELVISLFNPTAKSTTKIAQKGAGEEDWHAIFTTPVERVTTCTIIMEVLSPPSVSLPPPISFYTLPVPKPEDLVLHPELSHHCKKQVLASLYVLIEYR